MKINLMLCQRKSTEKRLEMERAAAQRLQPHHIEFFLASV